MRRITDVVIVGGGPAGLATAIAARRMGLEVTVLDARGPTIDKACGEGVMPDGAATLDALGAELTPDASAPFRGIRFQEGKTVATAYFGGRPGLGVRRTVLHRALVRRALAVGVNCLWHRRVVGVDPEGVRLQADRIRTRYVIGADGQSSRVRRWIGLQTPSTSSRLGLRRHYEIRPWTDVVEVHWSTGCEAYITPIAAGAICVAMLTDDPTLRFDAALRRFPELRGRLASARAIADDLAAPTISRRCRKVVHGRVALVGDASGSVDAITGLGVALALRESLSLAAAMCDGDLGAYQRAHARSLRIPSRMSALMLTIDRHPRIRRRALGVLQRWPGVFRRLLALHTCAADSRQPSPHVRPGIRCGRSRPSAWTDGLSARAGRLVEPNP